MALTPRGGVVAPTYQHPSGDPIMNYSASTPRKPIPPSAPRHVRSQRENIDAKRTALHTTLEQGWTTDNHVASIFSTYKREKALLLADALASAAASGSTATGTTPRTSLVPDGVGFNIGDGGSGCLTAERRAGAPLVSLPGRTPQQIQGTATQQHNRSPSPSASGRSPAPRNDDAAAADATGTAGVMLFQFVAAGDDYFCIAEHQRTAEAPQQQQQQQQSSTKTTANDTSQQQQQGEPTPPPPPLVWTVTAVPKEEKKNEDSAGKDAETKAEATPADDNKKSDPAADPDLESKPASQTQQDEAKKDDKALPSAPRHGAKLRLKHLTVDPTSKSLVHSPESDFAGTEFTLQKHVSGVSWTLQAGEHYLGVVPPEADSKDPRHVVALVTASSSASWQFVSVDAATHQYRLEVHETKSKLIVVHHGESHAIVTATADPPVGEGITTSEVHTLQFVGGEAEKNEASPKGSPAGATSSSPAAAPAKKKRKAKKPQGPECDYFITVEPLRTAAPSPPPASGSTAPASTTTKTAKSSAPPEQQWGLHPLTAAAADGSRLYFFTNRAFPQLYLCVEPGAAATLRRRPRGDQGIQGAVLVRSRQEVIVTSEHSPPKPAPKPPAEKVVVASSMRIGDKLDAGKYLQSPNGEHRLTLLATGNLVLEPIATVRARVKHAAAVLKKGPATQPQPSPQRGGATARPRSNGGNNSSTNNASSRNGASTARGTTSTAANDLPPAPPVPVWQTGTSSIGTTALTFAKPGVLALVVVGGDPHAGPLWQLAAYGTELRVGDDGVMQVLGTKAQIAEYKRRQARDANSDASHSDYSDDEETAKDDAKGSEEELVVVFSSADKKKPVETQKQPPPAAATKSAAPPPAAKVEEKEEPKATPPPAAAKKEPEAKPEAEPAKPTQHSGVLPTAGLDLKTPLLCDARPGLVLSLKDDGEGLVLSRDGQPLWSSKVPLSVDSTQRPRRALIVAAGGGDFVVEADDGAVLWRANVTAAASVKLSDSADALLIVDAHGKTLWRSDEPQPAPEAAASPAKEPEQQQQQQEASPTREGHSTPPPASQREEEAATTASPARPAEDKPAATPAKSEAAASPGPADNSAAAAASPTAPEKATEPSSPAPAPAAAEASPPAKAAQEPAASPEKAQAAEASPSTKSTGGSRVLDRLVPSDRLNPEERIKSADGKHILVHQSDGNLVLYEIATSKALWASNTDGKKTTHLVLVSDFGDFELSLLNGDAQVWQGTCSSSGETDAELVVRNGVAQVVAGGTEVLWSSDKP